MRRSTTLPCAVTYAGIDYHKKFSVVTLGDSAGKVILTQRIPNDCYAIKKFFNDFSNLQCAVESCRGYEWFVDLLKELKMTVHMANPYEVALIAKSRCKTDKVDSRILMELLAMGFLPTCYQPTAAERRLRERLRWRCHLVKNMTRIKLRIHSLLDKENLGLQLGETVFRGKSRKLLEETELQAPGRQQLLQKHLKLLEHFEKLVESEDTWIKKTAKANSDARLLMTIPGIGEFSSLVILAELGSVGRFTRAAQVVNFAGLVPTIRQSASSTFTGPITKQGPPILRWILVQNAWIAIRHCAPLRHFFLSVSKRCGRNGAIVATARKLLEIAFHVLKDQTPFDANRIGKQMA
jgi:transposase